MLHLPSRLCALARAATLAAACAFVASAALATDVTVTRVWQSAHAVGGIPGQKAEIVAYDDRTDTLWVAGVVGVDVLDRATGQRLASIDVRHLGAVNSVAIHDGLAALAIENAIDRTQPGVVAFFDTRTRRQLGAPVAVGALPDMLTFTPNGRQLLVANEGTPNPGSADDPVGSVSIVDVRTRRVTTLPIDASIPGYETLRLFPDTLSPYDPEPEYIAVDKTGQYAYVGLQEANGVAVLNLKARAFERIVPLGLKDFSLPGNELDPSDRPSGVIELVSASLSGLYQPDTLAAYEHKGRTYLVMANEGDAREDEADEARGSTLGATGVLARTTLSSVDSVAGGPWVAFGGRSISIRDRAGRIVYDSGSLLDAEAIRLGIYDDTRSDNKGVEPEGLALLHVEGRVLAFVGLERTLKAAIAVFDITDPHAVEYLDMIVGEGDRSPEGLTAFRVGRRHYVAIAHEVSDTTSLYEVRVSKRRGRDRH
ncbi:choice-of-anchor I family protein [Azohydromonas sediminis]|uniref:choice-of-anchor I family protein n=1 Tax=Azohydromonas sediminis TaxID=2259674 RepID=UPI0013C2A044|nr:choice-of-anchor I family protein [Azohydromonas sediminis]